MQNVIGCVCDVMFEEFGTAEGSSDVPRNPLISPGTVTGTCAGAFCLVMADTDKSW